MFFKGFNQVFIKTCIISLILSVLFVQTTISAPTRTEDIEDNIDSILNNPCKYNPHPHRHQRSSERQAQKNFSHVQSELKKVKKLTTKTLKMFRKMYQNSTTLKWRTFELVQDHLTTKVDGYHGLQIFIKAIYLMSNQSFPSTNMVSATKRSAKLIELLNKSTVLLCEIYDDIHLHNKTKEVLPVAKNENVVEVNEKFPVKMERTGLSTQDREVLKKYKKFLADLWRLYKQDKVEKRGNNKNKLNKNSSLKKKNQTSKKVKISSQKQRKKNTKRRESS